MPYCTNCGSKYETGINFCSECGNDLRKFTQSSSNQNSQLSVEELKELSEQGDANNQNKLGDRYYDGEGVEQNYIEAVRWYRKAAEQNHLDAQANLGICYEQGLGVEQNYMEAERWYRKAAEQGHADAQGYLGALNYLGLGIEQNHTEAERWFRKAAEQGHVEAQNLLIKLFDYDEKDIEIIEEGVDNTLQNKPQAMFNEFFKEQLEEFAALYKAQVKKDQEPVT